MECWYESWVFARLKEIDINDLSISWLQTGPWIDWILNVNLPLDPWFKPIRSFRC